MADFLGTNKKDEPEEEVQDESTFKVGDKTYSQEELGKLVELGNFAQEVETKQNTKLDKLYPEFTRKSQRLKEVEAEMEELKKAQEAQPQQQGDLTHEQISEARKAGQKIGFVTDDTMDDKFDKRFRERYLQERSAEKLLDKCDSLAGDIDGKDGRPAFKTEDVLSHMQETGFKDPEKAYKDKYEPQLDQWKASQMSKAKKPGMTTLEGSSAGSKQPSPIKVTADNLDEMTKAALRGE